MRALSAILATRHPARRGRTIARAQAALLAFLVTCVSTCAAIANGSESLRVTLDHRERVFSPGEELRIEVAADPAEIEAGLSFDLSVRVLRVGSNDVLWASEPQRVDAPSEGLAVAQLSAQLPEAEAAYRIVLEATQSNGFANRLIRNGSKSLAQREFQVLVFDPLQRAKTPTSWRVETELDPSSPSWRNRVQEWASWRRLPWVAPSVQSSLEGGAQRHPGGPYLTLPPAEARGESHWQAYPIEIKRPGEPCLIEVDTPPGSSQQLIVGVFERKSDGRLQRLCDPVLMEGSRWDDPQTTRTARLVCWPGSRNVLLVLANPHPTDPALFGRIRRLAPEFQEAAPESNPRLVALDWCKSDPLASVGLAAADPVENNLKRQTLQTQYLASQRLADRVQMSGANAAIIDVSLARGAQESDGQDLPSVALHDLLLREFERRGLKLLPALRLERPTDPTARIQAWVDENGDELPAGGDSLLREGVAEEFQRIIEERVDRWSAYQSFAGITVRVDPSTSALLAGDAWGFDRETVDRFLVEHDLRWPDTLPRSPAAHAAAIRQHSAELWRRWRYRQITAFYGSIGRRVLAVRPEGPGLVLMPEGLVTREKVRLVSTPNLSGNPVLEPLLLGLGALPPDEGSPLLPIPAPYLASPSTPLEEHASLASAAALVRRQLLAVAEDQPPRSTSHVSARVRRRLVRSAGALTPFGVDVDLEIEAIAAPGDSTAQGMMDSFLELDPTLVCDASAAAGGLLDERTVLLRRFIASLPAGPDRFEVDRTEEDRGDVQARVLEVRDGALVVVANASCWRREAQLTIDAAQRTRMSELLNDQTTGEQVWLEPGQHVLTVRLPAYGVASWDFEREGIRVLGLRSSPDQEGAAALTSEVQSLKTRDRTARMPLVGVDNPSFEARTADGAPEGWELFGAQPLAGDPIAPAAADGEHSLMLVADAAQASATSAPMELPTTGQFILNFQALGEELSEEASLRIEFFSEATGYRVHTVVPAESLATSEAKASWRPVIFGVDDLPLGVEGDLRVRFEFSGSGRLWIDDLRADGLMLPIEAYADSLSAEKLALVKIVHAAEIALEEGRLADCQAVLDGYWPRFMAEHFPQVAPSVAAQEEDPESSEQSDAEDQGSMAERVRSYLPGFMR